jgi:cytosine/adenosine deaminase-related metal-dependent hydrolase
MSKIYKNATILFGSDLRIRESAFIALDGEYITEMGVGSPPEGRDMGGAVIFPAFIDAHTHIGDFGAKDLAIGLPTEEAVSPPDSVKHRYLRSLDLTVLSEMLTQAVCEMLSVGIGAFADFREGGKLGSECLRKAASDSPIEAVIFSEPTYDPGNWEGYLQELQEITAVADGIAMSDITRLSDCQLAAVRKVLDSAGGKRLAVHIAETTDAQQVSQVRWGDSEVKRILPVSPDLLIHMTNADPSDISAVAAAEVPVVCCPRTNCILGDGIPPLYDLFCAGVPLSLGTDNYMFSSPNMFREMDYFSRLVRGQSRTPEAIDSKEVLLMATRNGAQALGIEDRYGSLDEGKVGSFVVLDTKTLNLLHTPDIYSAIVHRAGPADIKCVIARGQEVYRKEV